MQAHLARRRSCGHQIEASREERDWIRGREAEVVSWINQVDRAVANYRRVLAEKEAA